MSLEGINRVAESRLVDSLAFFKHHIGGRDHEYFGHLGAIVDINQEIEKREKENFNTAPQEELRRVLVVKFREYCFKNQYRIAKGI